MVHSPVRCLRDPAGVEVPAEVSDGLFSGCTRGSEEPRPVCAGPATETFRDIRPDGLRGISELLDVQQPGSGRDQLHDLTSYEIRCIEDGEVAV